MSVFVAAFTARGAALGGEIARALGAELCTPERLAAASHAEGFDSLAGWTAGVWPRAEAIVFVGAAGIAVRAIAPHVRDKFTDPAVVSVDEAGRFAVPLLSGHVGGANALAKRIAAVTGGVAAVSTATDVNGLFAVDAWAGENSLAVSDRTLAKKVSAGLLEGKNIRLVSDWPVEGRPPRGVAADGEQEVYITTKTEPRDKLRLIPRCVTLGIGCRRGAAFEEIDSLAREVLALSGTDLRAVGRVCSIDIKKDEAGLLEFCRSIGLSLTVFTPQELMAVPGEFAASDFVLRTTGADNVCERAAVCGGGELIVRKRARGGVTAACAAVRPKLIFREDDR